MLFSKLDRSHVSDDEKLIREAAEQKPLSPAQQREYDKHAKIAELRDKAEKQD